MAANPVAHHFHCQIRQMEQSVISQKPQHVSGNSVALHEFPLSNHTAPIRCSESTKTRICRVALHPNVTSHQVVTPPALGIVSSGAIEPETPFWMSRAQQTPRS